MSLDVYASKLHFVRHMQPIAAELERRGVEVRRWSRMGEFDGWPVLTVTDREAADVAMVGCWADAVDVFPHKPVVYVEHGAGQTYIGTDGHGYAGAPGLDHVVAFVAPNEHVAQRWAERYPQAVVSAVGCPALDHVQRAPDVSRSLVAFAFHWDCSIVPETMPALPHYRAAVARYVRSGAPVVGAVHPRGAGMLTALWSDLGVPYMLHADELLARCAVLVADNTSLMYEAAALGVPIVALNAPWYRRDVEHGLRFWSHVPGQQIDHPDDLEGAIERAATFPHGPALRERATRRAYAAVDGHATCRAADLIEGVL